MLLRLRNVREVGTYGLLSRKVHFCSTVTFECCGIFKEVNGFGKSYIIYILKFPRLNCLKSKY